MKISDIAKEYEIDAANFVDYLEKVGVKLKFSFAGPVLEDDIQGHVRRYKEYVAQAELEREAIRKKEEEMQSALANMLITSGFNFDGYKITKLSLIHISEPTRPY